MSFIKIVTYIIIMILTVLITAFFFFFEIKENGIVAKDQNKPLLKIIASNLNKIIYNKATEYNPEGDLVPDEIDDQLKEKLKESID